MRNVNFLNSVKYPHVLSEEGISADPNLRANPLHSFLQFVIPNITSQKPLQSYSMEEIDDLHLSVIARELTNHRQQIQQKIALSFYNAAHYAQLSVMLGELQSYSPILRVLNL